jgi:hypothetical protein
MSSTKEKKGFLSRIWDLEKRFKIFTYAGLIFLSIKTYNISAKYDVLSEKHTELKVSFASLEQFNASLVANMVIYNRTFEDFPLPVWGKVKRNGRFPLQYLNKEYENIFGHHFNYDRYTIFGKNNFEILTDNPKIAQQYYENDVVVSITGKPLESIEYSKDSLGRLMTLRVLKWRSIKDNKDTIVYGMVKDIIKLKQ